MSRMRFSRRRALYGSAALLGTGLAACAGPRRTEVAQADPREGGIGGTGTYAGGDPAELGVYGTLTGFGSLLVNGLRLEVPSGLAVAGLPQGLPAPELAVGQTIAAEVRDGVVRHVVVVRPLVGAVDRVEPAARQLSLLGTQVEAAAIDLRGLAPGDRVAVSGIWREGRVIASRIDREAGPGPDAATGQLRRTLAGWSIGGTALDLGDFEDGAETGFASITGQWRDGRLAAERVVVGAAALFPPGTGRLSVEAYLAANGTAPGFHLSGFGIQLDPRSAIAPVPGRRAVFTGRYDGRFLIESSLPSATG